MLRVMIIDDESPARTRLKKLLKPLVNEKRLKVVAEADNGVDGLTRLADADVDVLFLDIKMPELDGFDVLERIDPAYRPIVIFTTAFDEYAIRAFEANAIDYLLKPISQERIEEAVRRAERVHGAPETLEARNQRLARLLDWLESDADVPAGGDIPRSDTSLRQISIPYRDRILIVHVDRLLSAEISEGITRLYILEDDPENSVPPVRQHIVAYTLEQLEAKLGSEACMRVHRSTIVQVPRIKEMIPWFSGRYKLILAGGHEVIASRERSKGLKERLML